MKPGCMRNDAPRDAHVRILDVIRRIPRGRVATYGDIARAAGLPRRHRLVGYVLRAVPLAAGVPWHRVVNAQGRVSVRDGNGPMRQRRRLEAEGVAFDGADRIDMAAHRWNAGEID